MKKIYKYTFLLNAIIAAILVLSLPSLAATASNDIDNKAPQRGETAWGHVVSDAMRAQTNSDLALVNAGSLVSGTLKAGEFEAAQVNALLSFPNDGVVVLSVSGAKLKAAAELSVRAYPTGSPAFLHGSGWTGTFDASASAGSRIKSLSVNGQEVSDDSTYRVAMPISLAQGGNGYFAYWDGANAEQSGATVSQAIMNYAQSRGSISADQNPRLRAQ